MATVTCAPKTMLNSNAKPRRRQNHCCDQCRRGKRACDATGRDSNEVCSNCIRTGKVCTFEKVLRTVKEKSHRPGEKSASAPSVSQADTRKSVSAAPDASLSDTFQNSVHTLSYRSISPPSLDAVDFSGFDAPPQERANSQDSTAFPDFNELCPSLTSEDFELITQDDMNGSSAILGWDSSHTYHQRDVGSDNQTTPSSIFSFGEDLYSNSSSTNSRKRKTPPQGQRSPKLKSRNYTNPFSDVTIATLAERTNKAIISESLTRIYQDTMENAMSCWITERTCPYIYEGLELSKTRTLEYLTGESFLKSGNRMIARICQLDRPTSTLRERPLTPHENNLSSRALKATIMAFASQWAQSASAVKQSTGHTPRFEALHDIIDGRPNSSLDGRDSSNFDRSLQESLWYDARKALHEAAEIDSFRVMFAQLIFSFIQKPLPRHQYAMIMKHKAKRGLKREPSVISNADIMSINSQDSGIKSSEIRPDHAVSDISRESQELQDLLDLQGRPVHIEAALLRLSTKRVHLEGSSRNLRQDLTDKMAITDRKSFNMLFWVTMMCDTIMAVFYNRPPVVSDEDSLILQVDPSTDPQSSITLGDPSTDNDIESSPWGTLLMKKAECTVHTTRSAWPFSEEHALALLADAAQVKVLLYRKIKRLSNCIFRRNSTKTIEAAIVDALNVYEYWNKAYGNFIIDCVRHHDELHPRVQSWYSVLIGHWHLGVLWLADCLDDVDQHERGDHLYGALRKSCRLTFEMRRTSAFQMADVCRVARPRNGSSFHQISDFHTTVSQGALLTEPWTEILIRCFARSADWFMVWLSELQSNSLPLASFGFDTLYENCAQCIGGLFDIGRKSDMSYLAALSLSHRLQNAFPNAPRVDDLLST
ncbi:hypothetical protein PV08_08885 [Exophiala spinifera]|uniref:Zn(2)-C6 fungal-type domain-containing protein n=1 Tax=Exophiala spinifera TaxID=91928 RepID=A0A0D2BR44_9EURO|nr:uncharacterized protein PV08_08885 [Exophiala spinifera]KIW13694.1 hypothetical protein PV08_08885 [Exophiala spinifera]